MAGKAYWQAKIWGILHDPALKALHNNSGRGDEGLWQKLECMQGWHSPKDKSALEVNLSRAWLDHVGLCDLIASASDRATIGRLPSNTAIDYNKDGIEIKHLLSGKSQTVKLSQWHERILEGDRANWLKWVEESIIEPIKHWEDPQKVYWWLWRCYPQQLAKALGSEQAETMLPLLPAETRLPDASLWSHTTMTSALAGALAGYHKDPEAYPKKGDRHLKLSRPHLATFSFSPIQELIKASRKMRDFWAGSWLLHYLSAKVAWTLAEKYGPDSLLYPCLYEQPLIDYWLREKYPDFQQWIKKPSERSILTAGFPNVIVCILPDNGEANGKNPVKAAMQYAKSTLKEEWRALGKKVLNDLQGNDEQWIKNLNHRTWEGWLECQWQTYWAAVPIGDLFVPLHQSPLKQDQYKQWENTENKFTQPKEKLLVEAESNFLKATYQTTLEDFKNTNSEHKSSFEKRPNLNVGSWWGSIFDLLRISLTSVKNARNWEMPTVFGPRSTLSGLGSIVHTEFIPNDTTDAQENHPIHKDWISEGYLKEQWKKKRMGRFDGKEQLNATEVIKRSLNRILEKKFQLERKDFYYPDLTSGVAGWLRKYPEKIDAYQDFCETISRDFKWSKKVQNESWGIPWIQENHPDLANPRLLHAGWLIEEYSDSDEKTKEQELKLLRSKIQKTFPAGQNPTDWYVIAAGDGDGMSEWLKGTKMKLYHDYLPEALDPKIEQLPDKLKASFQEFIQVKKRPGPSTHSALSRALLDFSNQLLPYLTEERYAGRLIYGGGDDVLAYTNLWEWDEWLWDIRQCFTGQTDPKSEFKDDGDYWQPLPDKPSSKLSQRPLFTMGSTATISFGLVIAHHSVPLAIALENLWEAEEKAKEHEYFTSHYHPENKYPCYAKKDAVQVRAIYGNGNILTATCKFKVFQIWRDLLEDFQGLDASLFEQAAQILEDHPIPIYEAIDPWVNAFGDRREQLKKIDPDKARNFSNKLIEWIQATWQTNQIDSDRSKNDQEKALKQRDQELKNWLKLAAFVKRNRQIL